MKPCCASSLAAKLADRKDLTAGGVAVLYGLILASGKDGTVVISTERLAQRLRKSRGHVSRVLADLVGFGLIDRESRPGRSSQYAIVYEPCSGCARCSAREPGVARQRTRGDAPEDHVSGNPSGNTSLRPTPSEPIGSSRSAGEFKPIPDEGVLSRADRAAWMRRIREGLRDAS